MKDFAVKDFAKLLVLLLSLSRPLQFSLRCKSWLFKILQLYYCLAGAVYFAFAHSV